MPRRLARAETADRNAVRTHDVRDDVDLRIAVDESPSRLEHRGMIERAQAPAEGGERFVGELLISDEDDLMLEPRMVNGRELGVVQAC